MLGTCIIRWFSCWGVVVSLGTFFSERNILIRLTVIVSGDSRKVDGCRSVVRDSKRFLLSQWTIRSMTLLDSEDRCNSLTALPHSSNIFILHGMRERDSSPSTPIRSLPGSCGRFLTKWWTRSFSCLLGRLVAQWRSVHVEVVLTTHTMTIFQCVCDAWWRITRPTLLSSDGRVGRLSLLRLMCIDSI